MMARRNMVTEDLEKVKQGLADQLPLHVCKMLKQKEVMTLLLSLIMLLSLLPRNYSPARR
jgi:hypothetical protein